MSQRAIRLTSTFRRRGTPQSKCGAQQLARYLIAVIMAVIVGGTAFAADWNPERGEYRRLLKDRVYVTGKIVCIEDLVKHRAGGADINVGEVGPATQGILTTDGKCWHVLENRRGQQIARNPAWIGHTIRVHGWVFPDAQLVEIDSLTDVVGDGNETQYRFCFDCQQLVPDHCFGTDAKNKPAVERATGKCMHTLYDATKGPADAKKSDAVGEKPKGDTHKQEHGSKGR